MDDFVGDNAADVFLLERERPPVRLAVANAPLVTVAFPAGKLGQERAWSPRQSNVHLVPRAIRLYKRSMDVVLSALGLLALAPLLAVLAYGVSRSGGPVFFGQMRVGLNGRTFKCYKFRSMVPEAERLLPLLLEKDAVLREEWRRHQKLTNDPRITRFGALLRKTSLDELPQLWNVLRGDMSLIGPRPILIEQYPMYGRAVKWYSAMRPGITGLWQVTARGDGDFQRRIALDCLYVRGYHPAHDLLILLKTIKVVLSGRGAR
jgi:lipopolysaccharide/colanic/teichoic acid biosynthesis glycosyltransferase